MKKSIHPTDYRPVVFQDSSGDFAFLTRSTAKSKETIKWKDGNEYPLIKVHISSASHPFYTGEEKIVDVEGRVDRFKARQAAAKSKKNALSNKGKKQVAEAENKEARAKEQAAQKLGASKPKTQEKKVPKPAKKPVQEKKTEK